MYDKYSFQSKKKKKGNLVEEIFVIRDMAFDYTSKIILNHCCLLFFKICNYPFINFKMN